MGLRVEPVDGERAICADLAEARAGEGYAVPRESGERVCEKEREREWKHASDTRYLPESTRERAERV